MVGRAAEGVGRVVGVGGGRVARQVVPAAHAVLAEVDLLAVHRRVVAPAAYPAGGLSLAVQTSSL